MGRFVVLLQSCCRSTAGVLRMVEDRPGAQTGTAMKSRLQPEIAKEVELEGREERWGETQQKYERPIGDRGISGGKNLPLRKGDR